jgi:hypothetical protein
MEGKELSSFSPVVIQICDFSIPRNNWRKWFFAYDPKNEASILNFGSYFGMGVPSYNGGRTGNTWSNK